MRLLTRQGYLIEEQGMTYLAEADTDRALAPLQAASCTYRIALGPRAGQKVLTLQSLPSQARPSSQELRVKAHGFSLHAAVRWRADQRRELEHLCRYITRPAIANERLKRNRANQVVLQLKSPYKDGTTHVVMSPMEFMERLAALVPRPRLHLIPFDRVRAGRFHGVLAPNAKLRSKIIPSARAGGRALKRSRSCPPTHRAHELGPAAQTGLRHRHRTLPELRRQLEDHRRHRRSASDCQNPRPSGPADPRPAARPGAAIRFIPDNLRAENRLPTQADGAALSSSVRRDLEHFARHRPLRRPSRPKQHRGFHQTEMKLTTLRAGDIARTRKKGCLNFLYLKDTPNFPLHKGESSDYRKGWKQWLSRANHAT